MIKTSVWDHRRTAYLLYQENDPINTRFLRPVAFGSPLSDIDLSVATSPIAIHPPEVGDMDDIIGRGQPDNWTVNDRVRTLIDQIEPHVHTFIPVNLYDPETSRTWSGYNILYIGTAVDAVIIEKSVFFGGG
jgi:hypothetical protein